MLAGENGIITQAVQAKLNTEIGKLDEKIKVYEMRNLENANTILADNKIVQEIYVQDTGRELWIVKDLDSLDYDKRTGSKGKKFDENIKSINNVFELDDVYFIDRTDNTLYYVSKNKLYNLNGKNDVLNFRYNVVEANVDDWEISEKNGFLYLEKYVGNETEVVIPNFYNGKRVKGIGIFNIKRAWNFKVFENASNIEEITISPGIEKLGGNCFFGVNKVEEIEVPETVETIGGSCFYDCSKLMKVNIPKRVSSIGGSTFNGTGNLKEINLDKENQNFIMEDKVLYDKDKKRLIRCLPSCPIENYTISSSVTSMEKNVFINCNNLKKVYVPSSIKSLPDSTFFNCQNLSEVTLEEGITGIGQTSFYQCKSLKNIVLPQSVTSFRYGPFKGASLDKLVIPSSVSSLPNDMVSYCPLTEGLYIETENSEAFSVSRLSLNSVGKNAKVYVKNEEIKNKINETTGFSLDRIIIYSGNE